GARARPAALGAAPRGRHAARRAPGVGGGARHAARAGGRLPERDAVRAAAGRGGAVGPAKAERLDCPAMRPESDAPGPAGGGCALCGAPMDPHFTKRGWRFVRCTRCGLVSLAPIPDPAAIGDHHEASYRDGRYAAFAAADEIRAGIARDRLARVRPLAPDGPWLDVGCSTGAFLAVAAGGGLDVEGIDVSDAAVAEARRRGLAARQVPVEAFTPRRRYAVVTAFDVVEHLPDPAAFVSRVAGWLAPGGLLALTLPDVTSPTARLLGRYWFFCAPPDHIHYFSPTTVRHLLM